MVFSLDDTIDKYYPNGYLHCRRCGRYEHHPLIYCNGCGGMLTREKKMTWRNLLIDSAPHGTGVYSTITVAIIKGGWGIRAESLSLEDQKVLIEVEELYEKHTTEFKSRWKMTKEELLEKLKETDKVFSEYKYLVAYMSFYLEKKGLQGNYRKWIKDLERRWR